MEWINYLDLFLSIANAYFAYDNFKKGRDKAGWVSLFISSSCFVGAII